MAQAQPSTKTSTQDQRLVDAAEPAPADAEPRAEQAVNMAAKPTPPEVQLGGPEPKRFSVGKGQLKDVLTASWASLFRFGSGVFNMGYSVNLVKDLPEGQYAVSEIGGYKVKETSAVGSYPRPQKPLVIYEFEGCPFCRKVREAVALLDLDVLMLPCPKDGKTWRPEAKQKSGKGQFPYMVDPNTGVAMLESDAIIEYLFRTYSTNPLPPLGLRLGAFTALSCGLAMLPRALKGSAYTPSRLPEQPLVYWGYEGSPFCKLVREVLCELELPHLYRSCARGSPKRQELFERRGHFQVPYLEDPNTGKAMFESAAIVQYLRETYGA